MFTKTEVITFELPFFEGGTGVITKGMLDYRELNACYKDNNNIRIAINDADGKTVYEMYDVDAIEGAIVYKFRAGTSLLDVTVNADGTMEYNKREGGGGGGGEYVLPKATATTLGGVKAGNAGVNDNAKVHIDTAGHLVVEAYHKPAGGIPASDLAEGVVPAIPQALKNPNKLTFTGAVTAEYDGSEAVSVNIQSGGGGSEEWETISEDTFYEEIASYEKTFSKEYKKLRIYIKAVNASSQTNLGVSLSATAFAGNRQCYFTSPGNTTKYHFLNVNCFGVGYDIMSVVNSNIKAIGTDVIDASIGFASTTGGSYYTGEKVTRCLLNGITFGVGSKVAIFGLPK